MNVFFFCLDPRNRKQWPTRVGSPLISFALACPSFLVAPHFRMGFNFLIPLLLVSLVSFPSRVQGGPETSSEQTFWPAHLPSTKSTPQPSHGLNGGAGPLDSLLNEHRIINTVADREHSLLEGSKDARKERRYASTFFFFHFYAPPPSRLFFDCLFPSPSFQSIANTI